MSEPFIGEIRAFGFGFAPVGWARCQGQLLPVNQNQALYSLIGTTYGGNASSFAVPNLQGRVVVGWGGQYDLGINGGSETVTLVESQIPSHHHAITQSLTATLKAVDDEAEFPSPANHALAQSSQSAPLYSGDAPAAAMKTGSVTIGGTITCGNTGGSLGHSNLQPFQVLNYCIALVGLFPSRG